MRKFLKRKPVTEKEEVVLSFGFKLFFRFFYRPKVESLFASFARSVLYFILVLTLAFSLTSVFGTQQCLARDREQNEISDISPLLPGERAPDAVVTLLDGQKVRMSEWRAGRSVVLVVVDERTCLEINCPMGQLKATIPYLRSIGYVVTYLFSGSLKEGQTFKSKNQIASEFLVDESQGLAKRFGVLSTRLSSDAESSNVAPSVFLIGSDGLNRYQFSAVSPLAPLSGEVLLTAARVYQRAIVNAKDGL